MILLLIEWQNSRKAYKKQTLNIPISNSIHSYRPIRTVWEVMKAQTETSGLAHLKSAHQLSAELTKITEIGEQGRDKRRLKEEAVRYVKILAHIL